MGRRKTKGRLRKKEQARKGEWLEEGEFGKVEKDVQGKRRQDKDVEREVMMDRRGQGQIGRR